MTTHRHKDSRQQWTTSVTDPDLSPYATDADLAAAIAAVEAQMVLLSQRIEALEGVTIPPPVTPPVEPPPLGEVVRVTSIPALLTALARNSVGEIVVANGTYRATQASLQGPDGLAINSRFAGRTNPVLVRAETTGSVIFDGGNAINWLALYFGGGAHHQTWQGFRFANGRPTQTGVIYFGGSPAPHHITLRDITIDKTVTSVSTGSGDHGIYFSLADGGVHDILVDGYTVDGAGGLDSALHFHHSAAGQPNAYNVTVRRMTVNGTDQAVVLWDPTIRNIVIEDSTITGATSCAVRYEEGGTVILRRVKSTGSGNYGFYSSLGASPPGVTFDNCSLA